MAVLGFDAVSVTNGSWIKYVLVGLTRISDISCKILTAVLAEACLFSSGGGGMVGLIGGGLMEVEG